ncbi:MAG: HU family DNA-binding protein [Sciscionella sp.]
MNKAELIEALADRLGDKKTASAAVEGLVDVVVRTVHKGEKVNITGFGVFEKRARAARTARNPRTGATVKVKKTNVPAFRAGSTFKDVVSGAKKLPRVSAATRSAAASTSRAASATRTTATRSAATTRTRGAASTRPAAGRATAKASTTKPAARTTTTAKRATAKAAPKAAAKAPAKAKAAPKAVAKKTTAKKGKK